MIEGVIVTPLKKIEDERGAVMHMLRVDSPVFQQFGEIYFSSIKQGAVKAWKKQKSKILNYAVPFGSVHVVLFDDREQSPTHGNIEEYVLGPHQYRLLTIPPGVWTGFQGLASDVSIVANCASEPHQSSEAFHCRIDEPSIPYDWTS